MKNSSMRIVLLCFLLIFPLTTAFAGSGGSGIIVYGPSIAVPALGGPALVLLALLLGVVTLRLLKSRQAPGSHWLIVATGVTALVSGGSGFKLINDALAGVTPPSNLSMTLDAGGVLNVPAFQQCYDVFNNSNGTQYVERIQNLNGWVLGSCANAGVSTANAGSFVGTCSDNPPTRLLVNEFCTIYATSPDSNSG